jgi:hypothetical protein
VRREPSSRWEQRRLWLSVHDEDFQFDRDVIASTTTNIGGVTRHFDWDSFFNSSGNPILSSFPYPLVPCFTASGFDRDFSTMSGGTVYSHGRHEHLHTGQQGHAQHQLELGVRGQRHNKGDIQNAHAVAHTDPNTGDQKLYFALERNSNAGDANVAFWFLQEPTAKDPYGYCCLV